MKRYGRTRRGDILTAIAHDGLLTGHAALELQATLDRALAWVPEQVEARRRRTHRGARRRGAGAAPRSARAGNAPRPRAAERISPQAHRLIRGPSSSNRAGSRSRSNSRPSVTSRPMDASLSEPIPLNNASQARDAATAERIDPRTGATQEPNVSPAPRRPGSASCSSREAPRVARAHPPDPLCCRRATLDMRGRVPGLL